MISNPKASSGGGKAVAFTRCQNNEITLGAKTAITVLEEKARLYAAFINNSPQPITLSLGVKDKARINNGIVLAPFGGSFEINQNNLYQGVVSAIAPEKCSLSFVECIES